MYVLKSNISGNEYYFVKIYYSHKFKMKLYKTTFDVASATHFANYEQANDVLKKLGTHSSFKIYPVCPSCKRAYVGLSYPSAKNKNNICGRCKTNENLSVLY